MASARDRESSEEEEPYNSWHKDGHYYGDAQCNCYDCLSAVHAQVTQVMTQRQRQENDMVLWSFGGRRSPGGSDKSLPCYNEPSDNNK